MQSQGGSGRHRQPAEFLPLAAGAHIANQPLFHFTLFMGFHDEKSVQGQYRAAARAQQGTVLYSNELCLFATTLRHGLCLSLGLCFDLRCTGCIKYAVCVKAYMSETRSAVPLERCAHTLCGAPATSYYSNVTEDHI